VSATHSPVLRRVQPVSEAARVSVAVRTAAHMNEARDHRRQIVPSVEAEFDEVPRDALAIDRAMGSGDCSLNIAAGGIDLFQGWRASHRGS